MWECSSIKIRITKFGFINARLCENALEETYTLLLENPNAFYAPSKSRRLRLSAREP
jgi:hypothetical protein